MKRMIQLALWAMVLVGAVSAAPAWAGNETHATRLPTALPDALPETAERLEEPQGSVPVWLRPSWFVKAPPPLVLREPAAPTLFGDWSNGAALGCITPLALASSFAFGYGLTAPPPLDLGSAIAEYVADLGLKLCAPFVLPPDDLTRVPDLYGEDPPPADDPYRCGYTFNQPTLKGQYRNFMGIPIPWADVFPGRSWGEFGAPFVLHHNTAVNLSVSASLGERLGGDDYYLPVGVHTLTWRGETQLALQDFVFVYFPQWAWKRLGKLSELRRAYGEAIETTAELVVSLGLLEAPSPPLPSWTTMTNDEYQQVVIYDLEAPVVDGPRTLAVEAIEPGGISRRTLLGQLQRTLTVTDDCDGSPELYASNRFDLPEFFPPDAQNSHDVWWVAEDNGPSSSSHGPNQSESFRQRVTVQDTKPPIILTPPDIVTETTTLPAPIALGHPATFDLADLDPTVSHNACTRPGVVCSGGETRFPAGQTTVTWTARDASGNQSSASQLVNVKSVGSNQPPTASGQTGNQALDAISFEPVTITLRAQDPDADPLWFRIDDQPDHGFFHAPLYPYFIQDYRLANSGFGSFLEECAKQENRGEYLATNWPVDANFMAVANDGTAYVHDKGMVLCAQNGDVSTYYRLAVFRPDGSWEQSTSSFDVHDVYVDWRRERLYETESTKDGEAWIREYDLALNRLAQYRLDDAVPTQQAMDDARQGVIDEQGIIYVTNGFEFSGASQLRLYTATHDPSNGIYPQFLIDYSIPGAVFQDLALDSEGNLYASERNEDRIYKWSPATLAADGTFTPGELIGWMGRCDDGPGCDKANGRSFGYRCNDADCSLVASGGAQPGQFDFPRGIAVDRNDILYVTDYNNQRVQRFTPDGYFAGKAVSECDGSCFVLGDFGKPKQVTVNDSHFYVLDDDADLLHVFETTPLTRVDGQAAEIAYQSENNFVGTDTFTFSVGDGLDRSAPATVQVKVARNYRPPTAIGPLTATTEEDTPVVLPVDGYDPDEALDKLTYEAVEPPQNGTFSQQGANYIYTPDPDFAGEDVFTYAASDDVFLSEPQTVTVTVTPVNDPPRFPDGDDANYPIGFALRPASGFSGFGRLAPLGTAAGPMRVGRGFNTVFTVSFEDPDSADVNMVTVDWGDGSPVQAEGKLLDDGTMTGPVLAEGITGGPGTVNAEHVFDSSGDYTVDICISDNAAVDGEGNKSLTGASTTTCMPLAVTVAPMVDLLVDIRPSANPLPAGTPLAYELVVTNQAPESGAGLTATGIKITDTLDSRLKAGAITTAGGSCSKSGYVVTCSLDPLAPGESSTIDIAVQVPASIVPGDVLANHVAYEVDQDNQAETLENGDLLTVVAPADFVVNSLADEADAAPGDGACATADGGCSLRAAVEEANERPGATAISLADWQIFLQSELVVEGDVTISGVDAGATVVASNGQSRLFSVGSGGSLALSSLTLQGGSSEGDGGAVYNDGDVSLDRVQVSGNHASGEGGALWNGGTLTVADSSFTGNSADTGVGAIANEGTLLLENATVSGNRGQSGGLGGSGEATLTNVTMTDNHAEGDGGAFDASAGSFSLRNTIVAGNTATGAGPDCSGSFTSQGHNLLGDETGCTITGQRASDVVDQEARLAPMTLNRAGTMSHSLQGGSPAIDGGRCILPADQRGVSRPVDGDLDGTAACDIGAVEFEPLTQMLPVVLR